MKPSRYNVILPSPLDSKTHLLYNTLYDHQLVITDGEFSLVELFSKLTNNDPLNVDESAAARKLKELGLVTENNVDELKKFETWFTEKIKESEDTLTATIFTTLACNLRCTYCYEKDVLKQGEMSLKTARRINKWLIRHILCSTPKKVHLEFFGGEPLLNTRAITEIGTEISLICKWLGIDFSMGTITNGVLLTPEVADRLVEAGLDRVKITFDGDKEGHDQKRITAEGDGTFDTIFRNLEANAGKFKIIIGGNFDEQNVGRLPQLVKLLAKSKFKDDIIHVGFKPIVSEFGHKYQNLSSKCEAASFKENDLKVMFELREMIKSAGLPILDQIALGPCEFFRRNSVSIDTEGNIYKCPVLVGHEEFIAGDIWHYNLSKEGERQLSLKPWRNEKKCQGCPFLPICGGGCRATAWNETGDIKNISCDHGYFDLIIKSSIAKPCFASGSAKTKNSNHKRR